MQEERKKVTSLNLALVLVHDVLLAGGIQAGDGPIKQAILRHKTRLHGEFQKLKIKRGARSNVELAQSGDARAGLHHPFTRRMDSYLPHSTDPSLCSCQYNNVVARGRPQIFHGSRVRPGYSLWIYVQTLFFEGIPLDN